MCVDGAHPELIEHGMVSTRGLQEALPDNMPCCCGGRPRGHDLSRCPQQRAEQPQALHRLDGCQAYGGMYETQDTIITLSWKPPRLSKPQGRFQLTPYLVEAGGW